MPGVLKVIATKTYCVKLVCCIYSGFRLIVQCMHGRGTLFKAIGKGLLHSNTTLRTILISAVELVCDEVIFIDQLYLSKKSDLFIIIPESYAVFFIACFWLFCTFIRIEVRRWGMFGRMQRTGSRSALTDTFKRKSLYSQLRCRLIIILNEIGKHRVRDGRRPIYLFLRSHHGTTKINFIVKYPGMPGNTMSLQAWNGMERAIPCRTFRVWNNAGCYLGTWVAFYFNSVAPISSIIDWKGVQKSKQTI